MQRRPPARHDCTQAGTASGSGSAQHYIPQAPCNPSLILPQAGPYLTWTCTASPCKSRSASQATAAA